MTDNMMPELTLTPDTDAAAAVAVPELTLTPNAPEIPQEEEKKIEPVAMDESLLTEEERVAVDAFSKKIDIRDTNQVLQYGAAAQKSVASFSENALNNVRNKDMGEIGDDLSRLHAEGIVILADNKNDIIVFAVCEISEIGHFQISSFLYDTYIIARQSPFFKTFR